MRGRALLRVPLSRSDPRPQHPRRLDQPVRRDDGHAHGGPLRPRAARAGAVDLQHERLDHPARVRRGDLHARRAGDRGRLHEGLPRPGRRLLPARPLPRAGQGPEVRRRDQPDHDRPRRSAGRRSSGCSTTPTSSGSWRATWSNAQSFLFLGRHVGYPVALEGALKLKELAYLHAEGFAGGELKHGPIAVVDEGTPVFAIVPPRSRGPAPGQAGEQHPGSPGPRRADHRPGGGRRRRGRCRTPTTSSGCRRCRRCCSRWWPRSRCRSSRANWPHSSATTSTSRATWRSPSRSNEPGSAEVSIVGIGVDVVDLARFRATLERTPSVRDRLFTAGRGRALGRLAGGAVRRQGSPDEGATGAGRTAVARRRGGQ